jgi:hypothetical protein
MFAVKSGTRVQSNRDYGPLSSFYAKASSVGMKESSSLFRVQLGVQLQKHAVEAVDI